MHIGTQDAAIDNTVSDALADVFGVSWDKVYSARGTHPLVTVEITQAELEASTAARPHLFDHAIDTLNRGAANFAWMDRDWMFIELGSIHERPQEPQSSILAWELKFIPKCEAWRYHNAVARSVAAIVEQRMPAA